MLLIAVDQDEPIAAATCGVMFMAVPHRGSPNADYATIISGIVNLAARLSTGASEQLRQSSKDLLDLSSRFGNIQESLKFVSVLEGESTRQASWLGQGSFEVRGWTSRGDCLVADVLVKVVPPESARLNLGKRETTFSIAGADHQNMCKFASADDPQYLQVAGALEDLVETALGQRPQSPLQFEAGKDSFLSASGTAVFNCCL